MVERELLVGDPREREAEVQRIEKLCKHIA